MTMSDTASQIQFNHGDDGTFSEQAEEVIRSFVASPDADAIELTYDEELDDGTISAILNPKAPHGYTSHKGASGKVWFRGSWRPGDRPHRCRDPLGDGPPRYVYGISVYVSIHGDLWVLAGPYEGQPMHISAGNRFIIPTMRDPGSNEDNAHCNPPMKIFFKAD